MGQANSAQREEHQPIDSRSMVDNATGTGESMLERATRLHRYYFNPNPASTAEPLTPDSITPLQVCQIRMCLRQLLPEELVNPILDYAEIYTASKSSRHQRVVFDDRQGTLWSIADRQARERHWIYLASHSLFGRMPRAALATSTKDREPEEDTTESETQGNDKEEEEVPEDPGARNPWKIKRIQVSFESRDQGWTSEHYEGDDPFGGSYTWFEVAVGRDRAILPLTLDIQHNRRADRHVQHYEHDLPLGSPVLQQARKGDCLLLLAKARYAGWQNIVQMAELKIYYGF
ncbi:hypothetical protein NliqN6_0436 [Naganishia liquefaciens]|uniref:Uncharacterized protein n=1 Tax=Naganishia liquefaciens TaxID=104408 RepID=A0A8H3TPN1_9TREE|nr:hypothetical protein NliqN6_0436 [Naganishia liquefaciens]